MSEFDQFPPTELLAKAESFRIAPRLTVEARFGDGQKRWVIYNLGFVYNTFGEFEHEPSPSNRDDDFIARTRFDFATAYRLANDLIYTAPEEQRRQFFTYVTEIPPRRDT